MLIALVCEIGHQLGHEHDYVHEDTMEEMLSEIFTILTRFPDETSIGRRFPWFRPPMDIGDWSKPYAESARDGVIDALRRIFDANQLS